MDSLRHQYPVDAEPDGEGVLTAACDRLALADRVHPAGTPGEAHCPDCLSLTAANVVSRVEHVHFEHALAQQAELRNDTPDV